LKPVIHLYVWSGDAHQARELVRDRFAESTVEEFPHRRLRESTLAGRIAVLRGFRGRGLVFFVESLDDFRYHKLIACFHLLHRCRETVLCDASGRWETFETRRVLRALPGIAWSCFRDGLTLLGSWFSLRLKAVLSRPVTPSLVATGEVLFLLPSFASVGASGGAISHIRGFLSGVHKNGGTSRVFTGTHLPEIAFPSSLISRGGRDPVFWEAGMLAYNQRFAAEVEKLLAGAPRGAVLYQRHCPFAIAGALLARRLQIPLVLEYNGPMGWITDHWDPTPFRRWIVLAEEVSLRTATRIVVVSEALKAELIGRGIAAERIRVNPNGVDPDLFSPGPGREVGRRKLGVSDEEVLVGFAGSFSLWHGIEVLQEAIASLLSKPGRLRFVLMGNGLLHAHMRSSLAAYEAEGRVTFTGSIPSGQVIEYLDACDILVSPHIPMADGSRFFGSPTKLFEYMAMGKAIVASRLEQLAEVLEDDRTACLVTPGSVGELGDAIESLAADAERRARLGAAAREAAIDLHSWARNAAWALNDLPTRGPAPRAMGSEAIVSR
jgi:glycosyltransferase involved in cell wall biosynthesis